MRAIPFFLFFQDFCCVNLPALLLGGGATLFSSFFNFFLVFFAEFAIWHTPHIFSNFQTEFRAYK
jgi:hypothetical protein